MAQVEAQLTLIKLEVVVIQITTPLSTIQLAQGITTQAMS